MSETDAPTGAAEVPQDEDAPILAEFEKDELVPTTEPADEVKPPVAPGTPDKAIQKLQQDTAAALRRVDALEAKTDPLTTSEQRQLTAAKTKLAEVRDKLATFDPLDDGKHLAEATVEVGESVEKLLQRQDALEKRLTKKQREDDAWGQLEDEFPDVKVRSLWNKCCEDAQKVLNGQPIEAIEQLATNYLKERASAVQASRESGKEKETKKEPTKTPAGGGRVQVDATSQPAKQTTEYDDELQLARGLLPKD